MLFIAVARRVVPIPFLSFPLTLTHLRLDPPAVCRCSGGHNRHGTPLYLPSTRLIATWSTTYQQTAPVDAWIALLSAVGRPRLLQRSTQKSQRKVSL